MSNNELTHKNIRSGMLFCDRYRIERRLDEGGMATIYLAVDESTGLPVAIKVLFSHYSDNTVVQARFLDEGRIQAMLEHPNIVHVYEVLREPVLSFVMEYVDGETLEEYLRREAPLDERDIVDLFMPVMSAVGFAHSKGIVHRDIKPSNVLLQTTAGYPDPKVMDFGVAKVSRGKELTADGTTVGTLHYMSPEQIVGARNIDGRADIYSLGCSLYKLCTGEVPFNASSEFALMMAQVEAPPTPPTQLRPDLSSQMEEIILKALAKEPESRFQSIKEMTSALMNCGDRSDGTASVTRPIPDDILQFAMEADEVALDQTNQFRLEYLDPGAETVEGDAITMTHELSSDAVRKIAHDRLEAARRKSGQNLKSLAATSEKKIDELTTMPVSEAGEEWLPTTTERKPPDFDDIAETSEISAERSRQMPPVDPSKSGGFVAVEHTGVDSRDVTNIHISRKLRGEDLRKTREQSRPAKSTAAERPSLRSTSSAGRSNDRTSDEMDSNHPHHLIGEDGDDKTTEQRPSRLRPERKDEEDKTAEQRPSRLKAGRESEENETAEERPSARRLAALARSNDGDKDGDGSGPHNNQESGEHRPPKQITSGNSGAATANHNANDDESGGWIWIAIGVVALMLALVILLAVILNR